MDNNTVSVRKISATQHQSQSNASLTFLPMVPTFFKISPQINLFN